MDNFLTSIIPNIKDSNYKDGLLFLFNLTLPGYFFLFLAYQNLVINGAYIGNLPLIFIISVIEYMIAQIIVNNFISKSKETTKVIEKSYGDLNDAKSSLMRSALILTESKFISFLNKLKKENTNDDLVKLDEFNILQKDIIDINIIISSYENELTNLQKNLNFNLEKLIALFLLSINSIAYILSNLNSHFHNEIFQASLVSALIISILISFIYRVFITTPSSKRNNT